MINDINYLAVVKQEAQELRDRAAQNRLADEARRARRHQRAVERENRLLERAVNGHVDRWGQLLDLLHIGRLSTRGRIHQEHNESAGARADAPERPAERRTEASSDHC